MIRDNLLRGDRVRLTALGSADLAALARWQQDAGFLRLFDARPAFPKSDLVRVVERQSKGDGCFFVWRAAHRGRRFVGFY